MEDLLNANRNYYASKISSLTKLYNQTLKMYHISLNDEIDDRSFGNILSFSRHDIRNMTNCNNLMTRLHDDYYRFKNSETYLYAKYSPVVLREIKYEIRNLQRELSNYTKN